jgi:hypothetical protein
MGCCRGELCSAHKLSGVICNCHCRMHHALDEIVHGHIERFKNMHVYVLGWKSWSKWFMLCFEMVTCLAVAAAAVRGPVVVVDNYDSFTYNLCQVLSGRLLSLLAGCQLSSGLVCLGVWRLTHSHSRSGNQNAILGPMTSCQEDLTCSVSAGRLQSLIACWLCTLCVAQQLREFHRNEFHSP